VRRLVLVTLALASIGTASTAWDGNSDLRNSNRRLGGDNAYGLGVGMDRFGRAYNHDPLRQLQPNAYGPGVGMDQYGRAVRHDPLFDW
jgi:hypothetical protein